jgi:hypothetical protein
VPADTETRAVLKTNPVLHSKALTSGDQQGTFEAIISLFGVPDTVRDVTEAGAFVDSIKAELPKLVWSHDYMTPPIGVTLEMAELSLSDVQALVPNGVPDGTTGGLYAKGRLLVDTENGEDVPLARHIWAAFMAAGGDGRPALDEFSWRGAVLLETIEQRDEGQLPLYHLNKVDLVEWGPCLKGCHPETELLAAKSVIEAGKVERSKAISLLGLDKPDEKTTDATGDGDTEKGALAVTQLSFAPQDRPWDNAAAKSRVHGWAEKPDGGYDPSKLRQAYLWIDGGAPADQVTSYRFIVADLIAGELKYVPRAIFAAANVLQGGRGGTTIGDSGVAELKKSVERLYGQMRKQFDDPTLTVPWDDSAQKASRPDEPIELTPERLGVAELLLP